VDETGLQLTYSSGSLKLVAVNDTERVHTAARGGKGETVAVADCMNASGSNSVPLVVPVQKSIARRCLPEVGTTNMTPKSYLTRSALQQRVLQIFASFQSSFTIRTAP
jgi:hypothetical protein